MSKVVLITGASSGIGAATASLLAKKGYRVYGTSRKPNEEQRDFSMLQLDVLQKESILEAVREVVRREGRLDVLVNNAGMGITGPLEETPTDEMRKVYETNFFGAIEVIKAVLPVMREQGAGRIVNITSIAGYMGLPYRGIYSATKASLEIITESLSMEVRDFGIRVVSMAPGDFATNIAAGRFHSPVLGDSPYRESYSKNLQLMDSHVSEGDDPEAMAERICAVIETADPKIHYKVGAFLQKFSIVLKRILPDRVYERLLMRHYGM